LRTTGALSAGMVLLKPSRLFADGRPTDGWRTFEVTTRVEVRKPSGSTLVWIPAALIVETPYQKTMSNSYNAENGSVKLVESRKTALGMVAARFAPGATPIVTVTSRVATKNRAVDLSVPGRAPAAAKAELEPFLKSTKLIPTDGIVKQTADVVTKDAKTDVEKARALYEWVVDNTFRDPKTQGCGID